MADIGAVWRSKVTQYTCTWRQSILGTVGR